MKILYLPVNKGPFEVMITGEKSNEYRKPSFWIKSRLLKSGVPKKIDFVKLVQGYGNDRPYLIARFESFHRAKINYSMEYSNGLKIKIRKGDYNIKLGTIIERGNINFPGQQLRLIDHLNIRL